MEGLPNQDYGDGSYCLTQKEDVYGVLFIFIESQ